MLCPGLTSARWVGVGESLAAASSAAASSSSPAARGTGGVVRCGSAPGPRPRRYRPDPRPLGCTGAREPPPPGSPRQPLGEEAARLRRCGPRGRRAGGAAQPAPVQRFQAAAGPPQRAVAVSVETALPGGRGRDARRGRCGGAAGLGREGGSGAAGWVPDGTGEPGARRQVESGGEGTGEHGQRGGARGSVCAGGSPGGCGKAASGGWQAQRGRTRTGLPVREMSAASETGEVIVK